MAGIHRLLDMIDLLRGSYEEGKKRYQQADDVDARDFAVVKLEVWAKKKAMIQQCIRTLDIEKEALFEVGCMRRVEEANS